MPEKRSNRRKTRVTDQNVLRALNEVLTMFNSFLRADLRLSPLKTSRDLLNLRQQLEIIASSGNSSPVPQDAPSHDREEIPDEIIRAFSSIATSAWCAQAKMIDSDTGEAKEEMRRVYRHVKAQLDALSRIGIKIVDMTGRAYDAGMALKVVTFEPTPELSREEITETIKPTIHFRGQLAQMGEVIVGTPQF